jgi:hypothetical protein
MDFSAIWRVMKMASVVEQFFFGSPAVLLQALYISEVYLRKL